MSIFDTKRDAVIDADTRESHPAIIHQPRDHLESTPGPHALDGPIVVQKLPGHAKFAMYRDAADHEDKPGTQEPNQ
jgi:hypothetical protein